MKRMKKGEVKRSVLCVSLIIGSPYLLSLIDSDTSTTRMVVMLAAYFCYSIYVFSVVMGRR